MGADAPLAESCLNRRRLPRRRGGRSGATPRLARPDPGEGERRSEPKRRRERSRLPLLLWSRNRRRSRRHVAAPCLR